MPYNPTAAQAGMAPRLSFQDWKAQQGLTNRSFGSPSVWPQYQDYLARWNRQYQAASQTAVRREPSAYETPTESAQRMSEEEWQAGLGRLGETRREFDVLGTPGDVQTQYMINREVERNAAALAREQNRTREQFAGSGLGRGGGLERAERGLREGFTRANISGERDIRAGTRDVRLAGLGTANQALAQAHFQRSFELPESGEGAAWQRPYTNYDWLYGGGARTPTATAAKTTSARAPAARRRLIAGG